MLRMANNNEDIFERISSYIKDGSVSTAEGRMELAIEIVALFHEDIGVAASDKAFKDIMDAYLRGYAWAGENPDSADFVYKAAYDYADKVTGAENG